MFGRFDIRQAETRILQDQLSGSAIAGMDSVLASINSELTVPGRLIAQSTPSLAVTVGSGIVANPSTSKNRVLPTLNTHVLNFLGGTITFPSMTGTIINSNGANASITIGASQFVAVLVEVSSTNQIVLTAGSAAGSLGAVVVPSSSSSNLQLGYIIAQSDGTGLIQNITNAMLYQFSGGGGGGSGSNSGPWIANHTPISNGASTASVSFTVNQPDTSYVILAAMQNLVDSFPQFQQVIVTSKSTSGFTVKWNFPTDSANYNLVYIIPSKLFVSAEAAISSGVSSLAATLPLPQNGANYPLMVELQNLVDASPQFQTALVTNETSSVATINWNSPTDSINYKAVYSVSATAQAPIGSSATSIVVSLPINFSNTNYEVIGIMYNILDTFPQFQTVLISSKSNNGFTASWNAPTDSADYVLLYYALSVSP